ncbi:hypothetical protein J6590_031864 [Homalodisca vitripennis]|nr:hypothetical protein J6590_031864 [Homalodisca vitripennis]
MKPNEHRIEMQAQEWCNSVLVLETGGCSSGSKTDPGALRSSTHTLTLLRPSPLPPVPDQDPPLSLPAPTLPAPSESPALAALAPSPTVTLLSAPPAPATIPAPTTPPTPPPPVAGSLTVPPTAISPTASKPPRCPE